jgi:hypothetical protein
MMAVPRLPCPATGQRGCSGMDQAWHDLGFSLALDAFATVCEISA